MLSKLHCTPQGFHPISVNLRTVDAGSSAPSAALTATVDMHPNLGSQVLTTDVVNSPKSSNRATVPVLCPSAPHRHHPKRLFGGYAGMCGSNSYISHIEQQALRHPAMCDSPAQQSPSASSASDIHKLLMLAKPIASAADLLIRIKGSAVNYSDDARSVKHHHKRRRLQLSAGSIEALSFMPASPRIPCQKRADNRLPLQTRLPVEHIALYEEDEVNSLPYPVRPKPSPTQPALQQDQPTPKAADPVGQFWDQKIGFNAGAVPPRAARAGPGSRPLQADFDQCQAEEHDLAFLSSQAYKGPASFVLAQSDTCPSGGSPGTPGLCFASPDTSVDGQSWPEDASTAYNTAAARGSKQQPLFQATFDMSLGASSPLGLQPLYNSPQPQTNGPLSYARPPAIGPSPLAAALSSWYPGSMV